MESLEEGVDEVSQSSDQKIVLHEGSHDEEAEFQRSRKKRFFEMGGNNSKQNYSYRLTMRKRVLKEYYSYDDFGYGNYDFGYGSYGGGFSSGKSGVMGTILGGVFNAGKVLVGATKEVARRIITGIKMIVPIIVGTFVPALQENYQKIFAEEKEDIKRIRAENEKVMKQVNAAFAGDAELFMFFAAPGAVTTGYLIKKAPQILDGMLSTVTGGVFDKTLRRHGRSDLFDSYRGPGGPLLSEKKDPEEEEKALKAKMEATALVDKAFRESPQAQIIRKELMERHAKTLRQAIEMANAVLGANSLDELERITGKSVPAEAMALMKGEAKPQPSKKPQPNDEEEKEEDEQSVTLTPEDRQMAEAQTLESTKAAIKNFYALPIKAFIEAATRLGVPRSHPIVAKHEEVIQRMGAQ